MKSKSNKLTISALFLDCLFLPFLTGQIPQIGSVLSPMHIPVLICGFICGGPYGLVVGFLAPIIRYFLFGMPPIFPVGIAMAFELAAYGLASGILYRSLPRKNRFIYVSLVGAMLIGRIVWGISRFLMAIWFGVDFSFALFLGGAFITALPGILLHILIIPPILISLRKARVLENEF
jgi:riboflavin transporter FmnP